LLVKEYFDFFIFGVFELFTNSKVPSGLMYFDCTINCNSYLYFLLPAKLPLKTVSQVTVKPQSTLAQMSNYSWSKPANSHHRPLFFHRSHRFSSPLTPQAVTAATSFAKLSLWARR